VICLWDVGAADGTFSELFCQLVGGEGSVFAFESQPALYEMIQARVPNCEWLRVERATREGFGVPRSLVANGGAESGSLEVCCGDTTRERLGRIPEILKATIQGFN
jgi:hypothetical protein